MPEAQDGTVWTRIDSDAERRAPLPQLMLLEAQWRVLTPEGRIVSCGIYKSATGGPRGPRRSSHVGTTRLDH